MELRFQRLEDKIDTLNEHLSNILTTTIENTANLREHMRRTELNEEQVALLRELIDIHKKDLETKLDPVLTFVDRIKFTLTALSFLGALILSLDKLGYLPLIFKV